MSTKTIKEALEYVATHPEPSAEPIDMPVWEHIARALYEIATVPKGRGGLTRATRAQSMILDRTTGKRRAGSRPIAGGETAVTFRDLTEGQITGGSRDD